MKGSKTDRDRAWWICAVLVVASFLSYAPVWNAYFLADDFAYVGLYANRPFGDWLEIIARDWTKSIWGHPNDELRSMMGLAFWWDGRLWPFQPAGYHTTNLAFHAANTLLVFFLARTILAGALATSFLAALLFSVHPVHSEAVSWISGRADPICAFFSLASLWAFMRYRSSRRVGLYAISLAAFFFALFSKEIAIAFPLLLLGFDLFRRKGTRESYRGLIPGYAGFLVVLAIYMVIRGAQFPHAIREDALTVSVLRSFAARQIDYLHFLFPLPGPHIVVPILLLCGLAGLLLIRRVRRALDGLFEWRKAALFFGPWWYLAGVLPLVVTYTSPRHLYLASVGVCLLIPVLMRVLLSTRVFAVVAVGLVLGDAALLLRYNLRWHNAATVSDRARRTIEQLARTTAPGSGLLLDIPETLGAQYLWLASLPFALEPPYTRTPIYRHFRVIERPMSYKYWDSPDGSGRTWVQDKLPVLTDLISNPADSYLVSLDGNHQIAIGRIPASDTSRRLRPLFEFLVPRRPSDTIDYLNVEWNRLWRHSQEAF